MIGIWQRFHRNFELTVFRINHARPVTSTTWNSARLFTRPLFIMSYIQGTSYTVSLTIIGAAWRVPCSYYTTCRVQRVPWLILHYMHGTTRTLMILHYMQGTNAYPAHTTLHAWYNAYPAHTTLHARYNAYPAHTTLHARYNACTQVGINLRYWLHCHSNLRVRIERDINRVTFGKLVTLFVQKLKILGKKADL